MMISKTEGLWEKSAFKYKAKNRKEILWGNIIVL